ncbi:hypothetical protein S7711_10363 [Stachybotrys chartarum IBT 7711]|uniref:Uncharacterized protein n=1 Tax=Stachybotrys chartarum (strain CBS 109288 / IBT 7711) TaxID=1280523 RepID=A0A084B9S8_STACB|nr:hypothetical protein S7711_10363 [Stachybotrys chartarum IBT 7711]
MPPRKFPKMPLRLTRRRAQLAGAPPLMRGLDQRGQPIDPLPADPEWIPFDDALRRTRSRIITGASTSTSRQARQARNRWPPPTRGRPSRSARARSQPSQTPLAPSSSSSDDRSSVSSESEISSCIVVALPDFSAAHSDYLEAPASPSPEPQPHAAEEPAGAAFPVEEEEENTVIAATDSSDTGESSDSDDRIVVGFDGIAINSYSSIRTPKPQSQCSASPKIGESRIRVGRANTRDSKTALDIEIEEGVKVILEGRPTPKTPSALSPGNEAKGVILAGTPVPRDVLKSKIQQLGSSEAPEALSAPRTEKCTRFLLGSRERIPGYESFAGEAWNLQNTLSQPTEQDERIAVNRLDMSEIWSPREVDASGTPKAPSQGNASEGDVGSEGSTRENTPERISQLVEETTVVLERELAQMSAQGLTPRRALLYPKSSSRQRCGSR